SVANGGAESDARTKILKHGAPPATKDRMPADRMNERREQRGSIRVFSALGKVSQARSRCTVISRGKTALPRAATLGDRSGRTLAFCHQRCDGTTNAAQLPNPRFQVCECGAVGEQEVNTTRR